LKTRIVTTYQQLKCQRALISSLTKVICERA